MICAFLVGQFCVVLFIALHDWVLLGRLNNLGGIRAVDSPSRRVLVTALSMLPFGVAFGASLYYQSARYPMWLMWTLWITYGFAACGMLRAWWIPYLFGNDPARAERYRTRFADTHSFLPERNGIRPDTLHTCFHAVFGVTVGLLIMVTVTR